MAYRTGPSPELAHVRAGDCMHHGILSCAADTPLGEVAGMMAEHRVHMIAVRGEDSERPVAVLSDLDLVAAAASGQEPSAVQAAATEPLAVSARDSLDRAAQLMTEHGVSHLVVHDPASGYPVGVLSTIDIVAVYASRSDQPAPPEPGVAPPR